MAPDYPGALALLTSKFASPNHRARLAFLPAFQSTAALKALDNTNGNNPSVATKEQLAMDVATSERNADAQLALAQNDNLKTEIEKHTAKVNITVSNSVAHTRKLLTLLRDSIRKENPASAEADLKTVEGLWSEMEKLADAAQEAKSALPTFLEKQKDNMSLYHTSSVNEAFQESQDELNILHKKVNLQHRLILDHQQAFEAYQADVEPKLKELTDLQERLPRLAVDKDVLRTELKKLQQKLESAQANKDQDAKKAEELQKELDQLISTKNDLAGECDTLRKTTTDLQEKVKAAEQKATDSYDKEIRRVTEQCDKESQKSAALDTLVKALRSGDTESKRTNEKLRIELNVLQEKYKNQGDEFSKLFTNLNDQSKKVTSLTADVDRFQKQNKDLYGQLAKLDALEKEAFELRKSTTELQMRFERLNTELTAAKDEASRAKQDVVSLSDKLKQAETENEELEEENNDLLARATEHKKTSTALSTALADNAKLTATVQELQNRPVTSNGASDDWALQDVQKKLRDSEMRNADLVKTVAEWTDVAKRSYKEYKDMQPVYEQAEKIRQENKELKKELAKVQSNGGTSGTGGDGGSTDVAYWKAKYEALLARVGK
ncbi:hypothetical protein K458DRAFT_297360 [Lentithecium fluviatile CBS 122367]|uniref:Uncharacterized protein n=1 Tax=Lentithecium fluviatile CBS 122367 TaxID=1168545 RepID=A0A6G1J9V6_9PLEO|nr:hypothetical protein K458DRAFT_297360 [Lentithecium fluviatile CBS 122367]